MHTLSIPQSVVDRVVARRGREHVYEDLDPAKTALVVVDMQNAFMLPGVAHALCPMAEKIVPNINRLAQAVRATGGTVIWIKTTFTGRRARELVDLFRDGDAGAGRQAHRRAHRRQQGPRALGVARRAAATISSSRRTASAPSSRARPNLAAVLRDRGLDTILVTGTVTNVCCESTARDAMMLNFRTIMVTDGNAAVTDEDHNASLARSTSPSATSCRPTG